MCFIFNPKVWMFFLISPWKHMLWYSLKAACWGTFNEYPQNILSWRNMKNIMWKPLLFKAKFFGWLFTFVRDCSNYLPWLFVRKFVKNKNTTIINSCDSPFRLYTNIYVLHTNILSHFIKKHFINISLSFNKNQFIFYQSICCNI